MHADCGYCWNTVDARRWVAAMWRAAETIGLPCKLIVAMGPAAAMEALLLRGLDHVQARPRDPKANHIKSSKAEDQNSIGPCTGEAQYTRGPKSNSLVSVIKLQNPFLHTAKFIHCICHTISYYGIDEC